MQKALSFGYQFTLKQQYRILQLASMYSSNAFPRNYSTQSHSNSHPSPYNQFSSYSQGAQNNLGSYRTPYSYEDHISNALTAAFPSWRQFPPSSISLREKTLHLSVIQLRIEDYYLIRTKNLKQLQVKQLQKCLTNNCFNKQLLENECYQLFPYSSQKEVNLNDLRSSQNMNSSKNNVFNPGGNVGNSNNPYSNMPAMFNSTTKTYGANNVFSNSLKEGINQGNNIYSNSQNSSNQLNISNGFFKQKDGQNNAGLNTSSNPFNQAFAARANGHNLSNQNINRGNQMTSQNQFTSSNSSNENIFANSTSNNNSYQVNSPPIFQNSQNNNYKPAENTQSNPFFVNNNNQQQQINNQISYIPNPIMGSQINHQKVNQNIAHSPQVYSNYQNITNQVAQFNYLVRQIEQIVKKNITTANDMFKQTPSGFLTTLHNEQELLKRDFYYQESIYYRQQTKKREQQQQIKIIIKENKQPSKRHRQQAQTKFNKDFGFLPVQSRLNNLNDYSINNDLQSSRVTVINRLKSSRIDQISHSVVYPNYHQECLYQCNAMFVIKWIDTSIPDKKIETKQPFKLEDIDFTNPKNVTALKQILKKEEPMIREDSSVIINYKKSNFSNIGNRMIVGVIEQRAVNLDPQCYKWSYEKIEYDKIYGLNIVKRVKNVNKTSITWENPINFLYLDFMGNQGFNLDICEVVCELPELNSRCRITFHDLPCKIKKIYEQKGHNAAYRRLQQFINKLNEEMELFSLCQISQNGSWTLIAQKFF